MTLNVLDIVRGTTVDGPGLRTSIYMAGCRHACPGCHNPQSWPFDAGTPTTLESIMQTVREEAFGVTLTGGDPLYHLPQTEALIDMIHAEGLDVWLYTGFTLQEILASPILKQVAGKADMIVEGRFEAALRDERLHFRGSANQHIVDPRQGFKIVDEQFS